MNILPALHCTAHPSIYTTPHAASGGYYIAMACDAIVAEELTLTGSIGVVLAKFNLQGLLRKIGMTL